MFGCNKDEDVNVNLAVESTFYFAPLNSDEWENITLSELGWNTSELGGLLTYLEESNTRAFIVLKDGKIVIEEYFGNNILGTAPFDRNTKWYWASAGKTLTATLVGIAQQEGLLNINNTTSSYLGNGWTSLTADKENMITIKNQLTMTTGLEYNVSDLDCTLPSCLTYRVLMLDNNGFIIMHHTHFKFKVVENATGLDYNDYSNQKVESVIGMNGQWISQGYNNVFWST